MLSWLRRDVDLFFVRMNNTPLTPSAATEGTLTHADYCCFIRVKPVPLLKGARGV